jgi:activator of HSP90 ATPase
MKIKVTTVEQKIIVPSTPTKIYDALMDSDKHSSFTGSKATIDPIVGGKFTAWDGYIQGKNTILERGKKIVQEWITTEWPKGYPPSTLELTFKETRDGTEITMTHSRVPAEQAEDIGQGWIDFYWTPLKKYFKK